MSNSSANSRRPEGYFRDFRIDYLSSDKEHLRIFGTLKSSGASEGSGSGTPMDRIKWTTARDYRDDGIWSFYDRRELINPRANEIGEVNLSFTSGPVETDEDGTLVSHQYNARTTGHIFYDAVSGRINQVSLWHIPYSAPGLESRNHYTTGSPDEAARESLTITYNPKESTDQHYQNPDGSWSTIQEKQWGKARVTYGDPWGTAQANDGTQSASAHDKGGSLLVDINEIESAVIELAGDSNILKIFPANWQGENIFENSPTFTPSTGKQQTASSSDTNDLISPPSTFTKAAADRITNFNPQKDTLEISTEAFGIEGNGTFKVAGNKNALKKAAKKAFDFIYEESRGRLYFNENGDQRGWGDGGITAIISGKPDLNTNNIVFS